MQKLFSIMVVLGTLIGLGLTSCSKSTPVLINDYKNAVKEQIDATGRGDSDAAQKASEKATKIAKELEGRNLTPEEKQQIMKAALEISEKVTSTGIQMMHNVINQASDDVENDYSGLSQMDFEPEE